MAIIEASRDEQPKILEQLKAQGIEVAFVSRSGDHMKLHLKDVSEKSTGDLQTLAEATKESVKTRETNIYDPDNLRILTAEELSAYVDKNVTDIASAKKYLKKLSLIVLYLYKRELKEI